MAQLKSNIFGGGSSKAGNIVMYERNGTACIRSMPLNYTYKKARTTATATKDESDTSIPASFQTTASVFIF